MRTKHCDGYNLTVETQEHTMVASAEPAPKLTLFSSLLALGHWFNVLRHSGSPTRVLGGCKPGIEDI